MGDWNDNNLSEILEYPFDFERYIQERLREIDDVDERRFAKTILTEGLGKVIKCTEQKYRELERRVYEEIEIADNQYEAVMTLVKREHYDPTNGTLYPVMEQDLNDDELREMLSSEGNVYIGTIYLKMDQAGVKDFRATGEFAGMLEGNGEGKEAKVLIQPSNRYRDMMESLYQVFQDNHIPWVTMNTGYLDKFFDVFVEASGEMTYEEIKMENVKIQFDKFEQFVTYGVVPLWNMEWVVFNSADFMMPCINGIYYEHEFSLEDKEEKDGYLIQTNEDILEIRQEKGKIVIKSQKETFEEWKALHIIQAKTIRSLDYNQPFLTNHKKDTFFRRYSENSHVQLMTKTDLFRRIMELDIGEYVEVVDYEICDRARDFPPEEGMNWFVREDLFPMESRKVLLLKFEEKKPGFYLNDSMVRFAVSQIQLEISEYRCVGVLTGVSSHMTD